MTALYHQAMQLFNRLQDHCKEQPEGPKRDKALKATRRAFNRACRRWTQWQENRLESRLAAKRTFTDADIEEERERA